MVLVEVLESTMIFLQENALGEFLTMGGGSADLVSTG